MSAIYRNGIQFSGVPLPPSYTDPAGTIQLFGGVTAPDGWLFCDGSEVSRTDYPELFSAIGTTYGSGDGSTTFNVPDLRGRVPVGINNGELPNGANSTWSTRNLNNKGGSEYLQNHAHSGTYTRPTVSSSGKVTGGITGGSHDHDVGYNSIGRGSGSSNFRQIGGTSMTSYVSSKTETHTHDLPNHTHTLTGGGFTVNGVQTTGHEAMTTGSGGNMPPFIAISYIICTGRFARYHGEVKIDGVQDVTVDGHSVVVDGLAEIVGGQSREVLSSVTASYSADNILHYNGTVLGASHFDKAVFIVFMSTSSTAARCSMTFVVFSPGANPEWNARTTSYYDNTCYPTIAFTSSGDAYAVFSTTATAGLSVSVIRIR